jgi:hypothetical protein
MSEMDDLKTRIARLERRQRLWLSGGNREIKDLQCDVARS